MVAATETVSAEVGEIVLGDKEEAFRVLEGSEKREDVRGAGPPCSEQRRVGLPLPSEGVGIEVRSQQELLLQDAQHERRAPAGPPTHPG